MLDPGTALAILSLAIDGGCTVIQFISNWKAVPASVQDFSRELTVLNGNLDRVKTILQSSEYNAAFNAQSNDVGNPYGLDDQEFVDALDSYQNQLQILQDELRGKESSFIGKHVQRFTRATRLDKLKVSIERVDRCCRQIQQRMSIDASILTAQIVSTVNTLLKGQGQLESWHTDEKNLAILAWTSSICFQQMHEDIFSKRYGSTGTWLLDTNEFLNWRNDNDLSSTPDTSGERRVPATLLAYGLPGAGKSVLAAVVIDHLQKTFESDKQTAVAYAYCSSSLEGRTCLDFIASLTRQIAQQHAGLPGILREEYRKYTNGAGSMSLLSYRHVLSSMIMSLRRTYIVFDALDEYESTKYRRESRNVTDIMENVQQILSMCGSKCRLFITSRNNTFYQFSNIKHSRIEIKANPEDIQSYIEGRIVDPRFNHAKVINNNPSLKSLLVETLVGKAEGQFLLTCLHLNSLHAQADVRRLRVKLSNLSVNLEDIYHDTMLRIRAQSNEDQELAFKVIRWISHAVHHVPLKELQHALAVEDGDKTFDSEGIVSKDRFVTACAGLVEIQSTEAKLVHPTVKEYLDARPEEEWYHKADEAMALRCLSYLSLEDFKSPCIPSGFKSRLEDYPFLEYAAHNFGIHASRCHDARSIVHQKCREFLDPNAIFRGSFQAIATKVLTLIPPQRIMGLEYPALHMAILCGLEQIVKDMLEKQTDVEAIGHKLETPLHMAVRTSSTTIVRMLLEKGAEVNATNWSSKSALDMVMIRPYQSWIIRTGGMDLADVAEIFMPLLICAVEKKWKADVDSGKSPQDIPRLLFSLLGGLFGKPQEQDPLNDMDRLAIDRILDAKLALDISKEDEEVVKLLIHYGIDINSQLFADLTALQLSALYERTSLIRYLLEHGANPFLKREAGYTALEIAEKRGNDEAVELLRCSMTQLEKQEEQMSDEAGKLDIPGPKQAMEYDARSKSLESRTTRRKRMVICKAKELKKAQERLQKQSPEIDVKGNIRQPPNAKGSTGTEATANALSCGEPRNHTLQVPTPPTELSFSLRPLISNHDKRLPGIIKNAAKTTESNPWQAVEHPQPAKPTNWPIIPIKEPKTSTTIAPTGIPDITLTPMPGKSALRAL